MGGYLPDVRDVRDRVDKGRARAKNHPHEFDEDHLTADGVEVYEKLRERIDRTSGVFCCYLCGDGITGKETWHLDHVVPLILRGPHATDNLEAACDVCNLRKGPVSLAVFLGSHMYAEFMKGGGLPPFQAMRERPVEELWERAPAVARRFARRPREVPFVEWREWYDPDTGREGFDRNIADVLHSRPRSERSKAMSVQDLCQPLGLKSNTSLADNYWLRCMGMNNRPGMPEQYFDKRLWPSQLVMPVRLGKRARYMGFRLRGGQLITGDGRGGSDGDLQIEDLDRPRSRMFPDQDELSL